MKIIIKIINYNKNYNKNNKKIKIISSSSTYIRSQNTIIYGKWEVL